MWNILVTGGAGFIGSNFIKHMLNSYEYMLINLDVLTYAGNLNNLMDIASHKNYQFVKGDICDRSLIDQVLREYEIDVIVNFAAESHVDRSISRPEVFLKTNTLGTQVLLEAAREYWGNSSGNKVKYIQVSTDEVYGSLGAYGLFTEVSTLAPNNPYSASKASADLLVRAYHRTYGLPINITRCSNNYGPYQFPEKLIPLMINNALNNKPLPIYGDGQQVRDWIYVKDHCLAIDTVLHKGVVGEIYNIGANNEKQNIEIVKLILNALGKSEDLITYVTDRKGHDRRYAIDNSKIITELGWSPLYNFEEGISETIEWYLRNTQWINAVTSGEYMVYYEKMYGTVKESEPHAV